ncbi:MAG: L,D-transpeptidase [Lacisediminihabitans sp.]
MNSRRLLSVLTAGIVGVILLAGCGRLVTDVGLSAATAVPTHTVTSAPQHPVGTSATATVPRVVVYSSLGGTEKLTLANPRPSGAPLTFLVVQSSNGWLEVDLPDRPNGSRGWIGASQVVLHDLVYSLRVSTEQNTLSLYSYSSLLKTYPAATGTGGTPTPHGSYYLTELLAPTNPGYGPYAFGLSAYSTVLSSFGGGPGQIGLHGTDDVTSIGRAASHGCIRLSNADITTLASTLPLGTPITIE